MPKTLQKPKSKKVKVANLGPIESFHFDRRISQILVVFPAEPVLYTPDLARWFGISEMCAKIWRLRGCGPPFSKPSPHIVQYSRVIVIQWLKDRQQAAESRLTGVAS
jgi:hypothetical protein